jgi:hypothetical protein
LACLRIAIWASIAKRIDFVIVRSAPPQAG